MSYIRPCKISYDLEKVLRDLAKVSQDLAKVSQDLAKVSQDLAKVSRDLTKLLQMFVKVSRDPIIFFPPCPLGGSVLSNKPNAIYNVSNVGLT